MWWEITSASVGRTMNLRTRCLGSRWKKTANERESQREEEGQRTCTVFLSLSLSQFLFITNYKNVNKTIRKEFWAPCREQRHYSPVLRHTVWLTSKGNSFLPSRRIFSTSTSRFCSTFGPHESGSSTHIILRTIFFPGKWETKISKSSPSASVFRCKLLPFILSPSTKLKIKEGSQSYFQAIVGEPVHICSLEWLVLQTLTHEARKAISRCNLGTWSFLAPCTVG